MNRNINMTTHLKSSEEFEIVEDDGYKTLAINSLAGTLDQPRTKGRYTIANRTHAEQIILQRRLKNEEEDEHSHTSSSSSDNEEKSESDDETSDENDEDAHKSDYQQWFAKYIRGGISRLIHKEEAALNNDKGDSASRMRLNPSKHLYEAVKVNAITEVRMLLDIKVVNMDKLLLQEEEQIEAQIIENKIASESRKVRAELTKIGDVDLNYRDAVLRESVLHVAAKYNRYNALLVILSSIIGENTKDECKQKLKAVVNLEDNEGVTPLMIACANGNFQVASLLIDHGASVYARDRDNWNPMLYAADSGNWHIVQILLGAKADITSTSENGDTVFHKAVSNGHLLCVKTLIHTKEFNLDVLNQQNREGNTCLIQAAYFGRRSLLHLLLSSGANEEMENQKGETAYTILPSQFAIHDYMDMLHDKKNDIAYCKLNDEEFIPNEDQIYIETSLPKHPHAAQLKLRQINVNIIRNTVEELNKTVSKEFVVTPGLTPEAAHREIRDYRIRHCKSFTENKTKPLDTEKALTYAEDADEAMLQQEYLVASLMYELALLSDSSNLYFKIGLATSRKYIEFDDQQAIEEALEREHMSHMIAVSNYSSGEKYCKLKDWWKARKFVLAACRHDENNRKYQYVKRRLNEVIKWLDQKKKPILSKKTLNFMKNLANSKKIEIESESEEEEEEVEGEETNNGSNILLNGDTKQDDEKEFMANDEKIDDDKKQQPSYIDMFASLSSIKPQQQNNK